MVNSLAICLKMIAQKDTIKVKAFVNFWMEKIEIEVTDEEDYDYPKLVLRNTLCNLLFEMGDFVDCIKQCNFTIKEVSNDIKLFSSASPVQRSRMKEKAKIMILAILYKIDSLLCMKQGSKSVLQDTLNKCNALVERFELNQDSALVESIKSKARLIEKNAKDDQAQGYSIKSIGASTLAKKNSEKKFIIKSFKKDETSINKSKSKRDNLGSKTERYVHKKTVRENSPKLSCDKESLTIEDCHRSPKSVVFASRTKLNLDRGFPSMPKDRRLQSSSRTNVKGILRNRSNELKRLTARDSKFLENIRKEFGKEISELVHLSDTLKKEVVAMKKSSRRQHTQPDQVKRSSSIDDDSFLFDDNKSTPENKFNNEISNKIQSILESQVEWERQRNLLNEKLERLEKNIDRQTADETSSFVNQPTSTNMPRRHSILKESSVKNGNQQEFAAALQKKRPSFSFGALAGQAKGGSLPRLTDTMSQKSANPGPSPSAMTAKTAKSRVHQLHYSSFEKVVDYCFSQLNKPPSPESLVDVASIKQQTVLDGKIFDVVYEFTHGSGGTDLDCGFKMKLFEEGADPRGEPIACDSSSGEELMYILKKINVLEVLPSHLSVTSFVHISYIVNFILHKFVYVT